MILKIFKYQLLYVAMIALGFTACQEAEKPAPPRKKMPGVYAPVTSDSCALGMMQQNSAFPFETRVLDLSAGDVTTTYYSVALPDTTYDALAFGMVEKYRHLAKPMLEQWLQSKRKGIILDLRTNANELKSAAYLIQVDSIQVPLEVYWDEQATARSSRYLRLLTTVPGIKAIAQ
ncbi:hypothetical protein ACE38W_04025 [Chitinophaga sp. Hz27]|uniref:hypothetical protein n=1 Tax=Chitinophaga sp. Hz27 TaxID=3347169 RepID=UPI0035D8AD9C